MKIIHLTSNDARAGGAIQINRLHQALLKSKDNSHVIVGSSWSPSELEQSIPRNVLWRSFDWCARRIGDMLSLPHLYRPSFKLWKTAIESFKPDVIHIHWTYGAGGSLTIPLSALRFLSEHYPLIWTFHDMWAFTGGCTNALGCDLWKKQCGRCPQISDSNNTSTLRLRHDTTAILWRVKRFYYKHSNFAIICPSEWLADLVRKSPLVGDKSVYCIPNGLNTEVFRPISQMTCRESLGIPSDKKILLYIGKATSVYSYHDRLPILKKSLKILKEKNQELSKKIILLIIGEQGESLAKECDNPAICLGAISRPDVMSAAYGSSDLLIYPTQYDNYPGVVQESLSCGIPVIASRVEGVPEIVHHMETGYLADRDVPEQFAEGINLILSNAELLSYLKVNSRAFALKTFREEIVVQKIISVYQEQIKLHGN